MFHKATTFFISNQSISQDVWYQPLQRMQNDVKYCTEQKASGIMNITNLIAM